MRKSITLEYVQQQYPKETWTYVFTDRSAEEAICNGGAGIYIKYPRGIEERFCLPTSLYSTNYKAEAEALRAASNHIQNSLHTSTNVVLLSDALSVLQAMQTGRDMELNSLASVLTRLTERHRVVLQWIPSHCNVHGNEAADALAKERTRKNQSDKSTTYSEAKTIIKVKQRDLWNQKHPHFDENDAYHSLTRSEQVTIFRLRTGPNRFKHHMHRLRICDTDQCLCGNGSQTVEHLLRSCTNHKSLRERIWLHPITMNQKLYGSQWDLQRTATFVAESRETI